MEPIKNNWGNSVLIIVFILTLILAIGSSYYRYFYSKNFDYLVEANCDPEVENCFYRDCESSPDDCPPNGLVNYKSYKVKAYDFKKCSDNSCLNECVSGTISCEVIACDVENGDVCTDDGLLEAQ